MGETTDPQLNDNTQFSNIASGFANESRKRKIVEIKIDEVCARATVLKHW